MSKMTAVKESTDIAKDQMNVVIVGHVDHGKSSIIGRLLADTNALPSGKLEQVRASCKRNAKPFEYAFLLDALKDEQSQGITIDTARCFFNTDKRRYILIDAPGHIEFLKNMITGAARAEAAFIVVDAGEGIQENSKRHGYMVSMLGVRQVCVLINKMDLVDYDEEIFDNIKSGYIDFLERLNVKPTSFIPISAIEGHNISSHSSRISWYQGPTVLDQLDAFEKEDDRISSPFRFPVQDIYKFTEQGDDRRIFAGTVASGEAKVGDDVVFLPSGKRTNIASIEMFNAPDASTVFAGAAVGFTLMTQVYIKPGEVMVRLTDKQPHVGCRLRVNLFWMGRAPMIPLKKYKLKLGTARTTVSLVKVLNVLDASALTSEQNKQQVDRHDVAECILETSKPVAFDLLGDNEITSRMVIIDNYEIAGAGIIIEDIAGDESTLKNHVQDREVAWVSSAITVDQRIEAYGHGAKFVVFTGAQNNPTKEELAMGLEKRLFDQCYKVHYLRIDNLMSGLDADIAHQAEIWEEHIRRLGELARILTGTGLIFITSISDVDDHDLQTLELLNKPNEIVVVNVGENSFDDFSVNLTIAESGNIDDGIDQVCELLKDKKVILDYCI